jgi:hypothetical protein
LNVPGATPWVLFRRVARVLQLILNLRVAHRRWFCEGGAFRFYRLHLSDPIDPNRLRLSSRIKFSAASNPIPGMRSQPSLHRIHECQRGKTRSEKVRHPPAQRGFCKSAEW